MGELVRAHGRRYAFCQGNNLCLAMNADKLTEPVNIRWMEY
jgi:hypothetical protein